MPLMIDLFSGLHGASAAFTENGWGVISIEKNRDLEATYHMDVSREKDQIIEILSKLERIDFLWASPPCYEFSLAYPAPRSVAARNGDLDLYEPDMSLVLATREIIQSVRPRYWAIENVQGACRYFKPVLGEHRIKLGAAYIWGNFPRLGFKEITKNHKQELFSKTGKNTPNRANVHAKIPYWISEQIRISVQYQMMLDDFAESLPQSRG